VLRQADGRSERRSAPWEVDPALLESLRAVTEDAAAIGSGARLVMTLPGETPQTLANARCGRAAWRAIADAVLERGEAMQTADVVAAPVDGPRGVRGVLLLYGSEGDARSAHAAAAHAARIKTAFETSEACQVAAQSTTQALLKTLATYDRGTARHAEAVRRLAMVLGREYGLSPYELLVLDRAALLHDLGKLGVPQQVLATREPLSADELVLMRQHSAFGESIVRMVPDLAACAPTIRHHHERWDGMGYPDRLSGAMIPIGARIIGLVDAYEVIRAGRPYRPARSREDAVAELAACSGTQLDPSLFKVFAAVPYHRLGL
jgi:hypothetical protein